jgi:lipid II:glycine glycyltransferase (peptidoglycan interpeptide bridge formation enzyme)
MTNKTLTHPLQSKEWGEFRKAWGNEIVWTKWGLLTLHKIPLTNYKIGMFIKGPKPTRQMFGDLKKLAKEKKLIFIKLEPNNAFDDRSIKYVEGGSEKNKLTKLLISEGCVSGKTLFTPTSFWIDLTKPEEEHLKSFSSKTRYNLRLAKKHGVEVMEDNSDKAFDKYLELTRETVERQGFFAHTERYHRLMWKYLYEIPKTQNSKNPIARLLIARYKNEIITTWIIFVYEDFLYYPYGASSEKYKNVMANNLMMWEAIRYGKALGLKIFDLWGREPGKGFTKFKEGYNPNVVEFLGTWDLVINKPLYYIYRVLEYLRWKFLKIPAKLGLIKPKF